MASLRGLIVLLGLCGTQGSAAALNHRQTAGQAGTRDAATLLHDCSSKALDNSITHSHTTAMHVRCAQLGSSSATPCMLQPGRRGMQAAGNDNAQCSMTHNTTLQEFNCRCAGNIASIGSSCVGCHLPKHSHRLSIHHTRSFPSPAECGASKHSSGSAAHTHAGMARARSYSTGAVGAWRLPSPPSCPQLHRSGR
jgi:hypothetical protein